MHAKLKKTKYRLLNVRVEDYQHSASSLLERPPPQDYLQEWKNILMRQAKNESTEGKVSVMVFRIGQEWLALETIYFNQVVPRRLIHRVPHRSGKVLLGVVNINGELQLCVALSQLLEIEQVITVHPNRVPYHQNRMIAIKKEHDLWIFPVDEIEGIQVWNLSAIENAPVNVAKSPVNYLKGIINVSHKSIGLLDDELLFYSLKRGIQ